MSKEACGPAVTGFELMQAKCIERVAEQIRAVAAPGDVSTAPGGV